MSKEMAKACKTLTEKPDGRTERLGELTIRRRKILKWIIRDRVVSIRPDENGSDWSPAMVSCEYSNTHTI